MKNYLVVWSPQAKDDLLSIYEFIARKSPQNADLVFDTLLELGDSLFKLPEAHPHEPSLAWKNDNYRFLPKWNYKIIYLIKSDEFQVHILAIFGTHQAPRKLILR